MAAPDTTANQVAAAQRSTATYQVKPPVATIQPGKAVPDGLDQSAIIQTLVAQVAELQEAVAQLQQALSTGTRPNSVTLYSSGRVNIHAAADVQIEAGAQVTVKASAVNLQSPMVKASGVLQCTTLIADSVNAASYTPGAGNLWWRRSSGPPRASAPLEFVYHPSLTKGTGTRPAVTPEAPIGVLGEHAHGTDRRTLHRP